MWARQFALFLVALTATSLRATAATSEATADGVLAADRSYEERWRFVLAAVDILITLIAWYAHHRTQPHPYRFQNRAESWLYGATVAFLILMCICRAVAAEVAHELTVPQRHQGELEAVVVLIGD